MEVAISNGSMAALVTLEQLCVSDKQGGQPDPEYMHLGQCRIFRYWYGDKSEKFQNHHPNRMGETTKRVDEIKLKWFSFGKPRKGMGRRCNSKS